MKRREAVIGVKESEKVKEEEWNDHKGRRETLTSGGR